MSDLMREQFEAAIVAMHAGTGMPQEDALTFLEVGSNGYTSVYTKAAWWAWQASREAVVVELPERAPNDDPYCGEPWDCGYNLALDESREAIKAQGLKVAQ